MYYQQDKPYNKMSLFDQYNILLSIVYKRDHLYRLGIHKCCSSWNKYMLSYPTEKCKRFLNFLHV